MNSAEALLQLLANCQRTTRATAQNEQSSRSHAILQIAVCEPAAQTWQASAERCKLSLVDLAGSEWAAKAQSDDRGNRLDGAEINKSLLCLKECIRALGANGAHVPFRGSKLTQVLKDSFVGKDSRTVMIANISPSNICCEHSINTIRYANRVKEWTAANAPAPSAAPPAPPPSAAPPAHHHHHDAQPPSHHHHHHASPPAAAPPRAAAPSAAPPISELEPLPPPPYSAPPPGEGRANPPAVGSVPRSSRSTSRLGSRTPSANPSANPSRAGSPPADEFLPIDCSPEQRLADTEHQREAADLSRSLRFSADQLKAERAAKMLLASEESLVAAHSTAVAQGAAMLPTEQRMLEQVGGASGGEVDEYVRTLREMIMQRREQLEALETALANYDASFASEDTARQNVRGPVCMPWDLT